MTDSWGTHDQLVEQIHEHEQQRPRRERLKRKGRWRNKYRLLEKWEHALEEYEGPGEAVLVDGYRPSGLCAPVDVPEIAGLIVWDAGRRAHHFRLKRDETVTFIESPEDPDAPITVDPMLDPTGRCKPNIYLTGGAPRAVTERLDALKVTPRWERACPDGKHTFELSSDTAPNFVWCVTCEIPRDTLSWLGHAVPRGEPDT